MRNNPDGLPVRRILIIIVLILWSASLWLYISSNPPASAVMPNVKYKLRAYTTAKDKAEKVLNSGRAMGLKGSISRTGRTIKKFMGYTVEQDFSSETTMRKAGYVKDLLKSKGYNLKVIKSPDGKKLTFRVKEIFKGKGEAEKVAQEIFEASTVTFNVRQHYKNSAYTAFMVVFPGIGAKEKAEELKAGISVYTTDTELVSY